MFVSARSWPEKNGKRHKSQDTYVTEVTLEVENFSPTECPEVDISVQ